MTVTYDSVGAGSAVTATTATIATTWSHTITTSDANTYVMTTVTQWYDTAFTSMTVTYGGNAMTLVEAFDRTGLLRIATYKLLTPPTGAQTVSISGVDTGSSGPSRYLAGNSVAYQGVGGVVTGGSGQSSGNPTTFTLAVSSGSAEILHAGAAGTQHFTSNSGTLRYDDSVQTYLRIQDTPGTGSSVNMTWTSAAGGASAAVAARLQPPAAANAGALLGMF